MVHCDETLLATSSSGRALFSTRPRTSLIVTLAFVPSGLLLLLFPLSCDNQSWLDGALASLLELLYVQRVRLDGEAQVAPGANTACSRQSFLTSKSRSCSTGIRQPKNTLHSCAHLQQRMASFRFPSCFFGELRAAPARLTLICLSRRENRSRISPSFHQS